MVRSPPLLPQPSRSRLRIDTLQGENATASRTRDPWRPVPSFRRIAALAACGLAVALSSAGSAEPPAPPVAELKKLSLDELFNQRISSVSKRPQRLAGAASATEVITQEDIRRSGATSLPEALRLAPNLAVARVDSRLWAVRINVDASRQEQLTISAKLLRLAEIVGNPAGKS